MGYVLAQWRGHCGAGPNSDSLTPHCPRTESPGGLATALPPCNVRSTVLHPGTAKSDPTWRPRPAQDAGPVEILSCTILNILLTFSCERMPQLLSAEARRPSSHCLRSPYRNLPERGDFAATLHSVSHGASGSVHGVAKLIPSGKYCKGALAPE